MGENNLSRFLYDIRLRNGYENVSDYLRKYNLPISDAYYRDIESGRKTLSLEKAMELSNKLPVDEEKKYNIFHHLLTDILPDTISEAILKPQTDNVYGDLKSIMDSMNHDLEINRESYLLAKYKSELSHIGEDDDIDLLDRNLHLLPILHYIYMTEKTDETSILRVCEKLCLSTTRDEVMRFVNKICISKDGFFFRKKPIFRIIKSSKSRDFKNKFVEYEISASAKKNVCPPFSEEGTFESSGIYAIPKSKLKKLSVRISDFLAELDCTDADVSDTNVQSFFVSIVTSERDDYHP